MFSVENIITNAVTQVDRFRNVCILAHVDHGKTTLADTLIATNNIISHRVAGKMRFMDSLDSEQERGITMKSSAVTLIHTFEGIPHQLNLIDSPGHVDFSSEVSTAVRLCDEAVIVVDVVEGVCPQTRTVLRQAWDEGLTLVLFLNKIDRLILELKQSPEQAYETIRHVIEQVNSIIGEFFASDIMKINFDQYVKTQLNLDSNKDSQASNNEKLHSWSTGLELTNDSKLYFHPENGEVIFGCAIDNWGFRISDFAKIWSKKLKIPFEIMNKALWGDYYLAPPTGKTEAIKSIKKGAKDKGKQNAFTQCILTQIWNLYETLLEKKELSKVEAIASSLDVEMTAKDLKTSDAHGLLRILLSSWLPLGHSCLDCIVQCCPSPKNSITKYRSIHMLYGDQNQNYRAADYMEKDLSKNLEIIEPILTPTCQALMNCDSNEDSPLIVFVSKVFWIEKSKFFRAEAGSKIELPSIKTAENSISGDSFKPTHSISESIKEPLATKNPFANAEFVALSRIFSGYCYAGRRVFVLGPKFDGSRLPDSVLDLDPNDLPVGPLMLPSSNVNANLSDSDQETIRSGSISSRSGSYPGASLYFRQKSDSLSDGSLCGAIYGTSPASITSNSWLNQAAEHSGINIYNQDASRIVRHVYVADITGVVRFLGGQHDILKVAPGERIPAGSVVGILGGDLIASLPKSGLLVSSLRMVSGEAIPGQFTSGVMPLAGLTVWHGAPLLSVSLEPGSTTSSDDIARLERGLRLLERSDPCAEVTVTQRGEYLLHASGEIHLQKCLEDFHKYFAPDLDVQVSSFCVPYRETIVESALKIDPLINLDCFTDDSKADAEDRLLRLMKNLKLIEQDETESDILAENMYGLNSVLEKGQTYANLVIPMSMFQLPDSRYKTRVYIRVTAHPMPNTFLNWIEGNAKALVTQMIKSHKVRNEKRYKESINLFYSELNKLMTKLDQEQLETCQSFEPVKSSIKWSNLTKQLLAFAPDNSGPNALFSRLRNDIFGFQSAWGVKIGAFVTQSDKESNSSCAGILMDCINLSAHAKALLRGFQIAAESGPLCAEPMRGVVFILEEVFAQQRHLLPLPPKLIDYYQKKDVSAIKTDQNSRNDLENFKVSEENEEDEEDEIVKLLREKQIAARRREKLHQLDMDWLGEDLLDDEEGQEWCDYIDEMDDADLAPTKTADAKKNGNFSTNVNRQKKYDFSYEDDGEDIIGIEDSLELNQRGGSKGSISLASIKKNHEAEMKDLYYWSSVPENNNKWLEELSAGYLTPAMTKACLLAFQGCPAQRLVLAMYDVELNARSDVLGKMYAVLHRRHAQIISEDVSEGDNAFCIRARLPVVESFGLANDIRKRTSGYVSMPQLRPGGWSVLEIDPLQRAVNTGQAAVGEEHRRIAESAQTMGSASIKDMTKSTNASSSKTVSKFGKLIRSKKINSTAKNSDSEEDGTRIDELNAELARVRRYLREVRLRKGLPVHEQLVVFADKQRTLKKNK